MIDGKWTGVDVVTHSQRRQRVLDALEAATDGGNESDWAAYRLFRLLHKIMSDDNFSDLAVEFFWAKTSSGVSVRGLHQEEIIEHYYHLRGALKLSSDGLFHTNGLGGSGRIDMRDWRVVDPEVYVERLQEFGIGHDELDIILGKIRGKIRKS